VEVRVHPVFISADSQLAKVDGVFNAILVEGDLVGNVLFYGQGAGPRPTSSAMIADIVSVARDILVSTGLRYRWQPEKKTIKPMSELVTRYYIRMTTADQAGVITRVTRVLGDNNISISAMVQKETDTATQSAEVVIMTHPANEAAMQKAITEMRQLDVVKEISNLIRVEDF
jgi:homoserine dehydrogenase